MFYVESEMIDDIVNGIPIRNLSNVEEFGFERHPLVYLGIILDL